VIVVDTSALVAILQHEPSAPACQKILEHESRVLISAGTFVEAMIVSRRRGFASTMEQFLHASISEIVPVTAERALLVAEANAMWGKSIHPAGLNFGDCFAYATAKEFGCPLLYIGNDFSRTDVVSAIARV
jgi:ribonuclease VapC